MFCFKREYFAERHLVETVPLLFPLTRFDYAGSLSSRTACHEKREQVIVVESGQLLNRIVQRAQSNSSEIPIVRSNGSLRYLPPRHLILSV